MKSSPVVDHVADHLKDGGALSDVDQRRFLVDYHTRYAGADDLFTVVSNENGEDSYAWLMKKVADQAALKPGSTIADIGCGSAYMIGQLEKLNIEANLVGVDPCEAQIQLANQSKYLPTTRFVEAFADNIAVGTASVDVITSHYSLMLLRPFSASLDEFARILVPGGKVLAVLPAPWSPAGNAIPAFSKLVTERMRRFYPSHPNVGVVNAECSSPDALTDAFADHGFQVSHDVKEYTLRGSAEEILEFVKLLYWFDLYPREYRDDFEVEMLQIFKDAADDKGIVVWGRSICFLAATKLA
ncbi:MAG: methyltransferase domain-containing protein [Proteobacteria bacterium]|nr:methyltransferase domain-containing protein [Pseudomonadota bacterium]